jgi:hypothetical protein
MEFSGVTVALLSGVIALQMPRTLLFQQVLDVARGLLRVVFCRALDSRDCVVWLALAIRTRVVVVATPLIPVVVLAANGVVLGVRLVFFVGLRSDHVLELGDGTRAAATEVFEGAMMIKTVLEKVDDLLVGNIDYSSSLVEEASHVLA